MLPVVCVRQTSQLCMFLHFARIRIETEFYADLEPICMVLLPMPIHSSQLYLDLLAISAVSNQVSLDLYAIIVLFNHVSLDLTAIIALCV